MSLLQKIKSDDFIFLSAMKCHPKRCDMFLSGPKSVSNFEMHMGVEIYPRQNFADIYRV